MDNKISCYIVIQDWMISELELSGNNLIVYALIHGFCMDGESYFYGSTKYIMQRLKISERGVINILNNLVEKGLVIKKTKALRNANGKLLNLYYTAISREKNNSQTTNGNNNSISIKKDISKITAKNDNKNCHVKNSPENISGENIAGIPLQKMQVSTEKVACSDLQKLQPIINKKNKDNKFNNKLRSSELSDQSTVTTKTYTDNTSSVRQQTAPPEIINKNGPTKNLSLSSPEFAHRAFAIWKEAGLPLPYGGFESFMVSEEFKSARRKLEYQGLAAETVLTACENYAKIIDMGSRSWFSNKLTIDSFVRKWTIKRFLPGNFDANSFLRTTKYMSAVMSEENNKKLELSF